MLIKEVSADEYSYSSQALERYFQSFSVALEFSVWLVNNSEVCKTKESRQGHKTPTLSEEEDDPRTCDEFLPTQC